MRVHVLSLSSSRLCLLQFTQQDRKETMVTLAPLDRKVGQPRSSDVVPPLSFTVLIGFRANACTHPFIELIVTLLCLKFFQQDRKETLESLDQRGRKVSGLGSSEVVRPLSLIARHINIRLFTHAEFVCDSLNRTTGTDR
jgi:hypothetical protein